MNKTLALLAGSVIVAGLSLGGCERSKLNVLMEEGANSPKPLLPAVPQLPEMPKQSMEENGETIHTVFGAHHNIRKLLNKEIDVRGYIVRVYTAYVPSDGGPPRVCNNKDRCSEQAPHIFIADNANEVEEEKMLMVTGYASFQQEMDDARRAKIDFDKENERRTQRHLPLLGADAGTAPPTNIPLDFDVGALITVHGTLRRESSNGRMAMSGGLIDYARHTTNTPSPNPVPPPPPPPP